PPASIPLLRSDLFSMESQSVSSPAKAGDPVPPGDAAEYWIPAFAGMTQEMCAPGSKIAHAAMLGLLAAILIGTAALAQAPRSVTISPDVPEAPEAAPAPAISPMRLELLNSTVKVENPAGVSVDLIPKLEVSPGSKIGFRISTRKTGYLILLDVDASGKL